MGDDDSVFFVDNIVDVLGQYDHTKYYYLGGQSEFIMLNYWFSFKQGFGGAGFMLSYPLVKTLSVDMESCLRRYAQLRSADLITMACIADIGVDVSAHKGIHQIDSGFLSSHPTSPLLSLHHFDMVAPIFPSKDHAESTSHLMKAAAVDQCRMLQQTICYHSKPTGPSPFLGATPHTYTKESWPGLISRNPSKPSNLGQTLPRRRITCSKRGCPPLNLVKHPMFVSEIHVLSLRTKRKEMDRCECCDVVCVAGGKAELKYRECMINEIIA